MTRFLTTTMLLAVMPAIAAAAPADHAADSGWVPLFDGRSLDGWVRRGGQAEYEAVDGMIVGSTARIDRRSIYRLVARLSNPR